MMGGAAGEWGRQRVLRGRLLAGQGLLDGIQHAFVGFGIRAQAAPFRTPPGELGRERITDIHRCQDAGFCMKAANALSVGRFGGMAWPL